MSKAKGSLGRAQGLGLRAVVVAAALALGPQPFALAQSQPNKPIIVRIPQDPPKSELSGLADVLLGSLGLTGVIVVAAVLLGAVMAGVMFWVRSRDSR
jgi:ABC-type phosphate transport system permease subunit